MVTLQTVSPFPQDLFGGLLRLCSRLLGRGVRHCGGQRQQFRGFIVRPEERDGQWLGFRVNLQENPIFYWKMDVLSNTGDHFSHSSSYTSKKSQFFG